MDISVILPFNVNRGYLEKAIASYHKQIFSGSSELVIEHSDYSSAYNANKGIKKAKGKYIKILHEDDELTPNCLQDLFDKAEEGFDIVCSNAYNLLNGKIMEQRSQVPITVGMMAEDYTIHGGTVLYRRAALIKIGYFSEELKYAEEFDLHLRLAVGGYRFGYVDSFTYLYRMHDHQKSMQGGFADGEAYLQRKRYILHNVIQKYAGNNCKVNCKVDF